MFHLLKAFANSLDPDQGQQNVTSDLDLNYLTLTDGIPESFFFFQKSLFWKKSADDKKLWKLIQ